MEERGLTTESSLSHRHSHSPDSARKLPEGKLTSGGDKNRLRDLTKDESNSNVRDNTDEPWGLTVPEGQILHGPTQ